MVGAGLKAVRTRRTAGGAGVVAGAGEIAAGVNQLGDRRRLGGEGHAARSGQGQRGQGKNAFHVSLQFQI